MSWDRSGAKRPNACPSETDREKTPARRLANACSIGEAAGMDWSSSSLARQAHRVRVLRSRYETLRRKLQRNDGLSEIERLDGSIDRRTRRLEHINQQIDRLFEERDRVEAEILGCYTGSEALLTDLVSRMEEIEGTDWTPIPIASFTMWELSGETMDDGAVAWRSRTAVGTCDHSAAGDLPHTTKACARGGCGIVGFRDLSKLGDVPSDGLVGVGRLHMSGRVVEHEHGYRAELAEVVALIATDGGRWFRTRDHNQIDDFFASPEATFGRLSAPIPDNAVLYIEMDLHLSGEGSKRGR